MAETLTAHLKAAFRSHSAFRLEHAQGRERGEELTVPLALADEAERGEPWLNAIFSTSAKSIPTDVPRCRREEVPLRESNPWSAVD